MTAPEPGSPATPTPASGLREWFGRWLGRLMVVCAVGTCINFAGLAIALILISNQASNGADARDRQQATFPVTVKAYSWIESQGGITSRDLSCIKSSDSCPARPK